MVTVSDAPTRSIVSPSPVADAAAGSEVEELRGELGRHDGRLIEVFTVPDEVDAVDVRGWHERGPMATYERPTG